MGKRGNNNKRGDKQQKGIISQEILYRLASSMFVAVADWAIFSPISLSLVLKISRSSVAITVSTGVPITYKGVREGGGEGVICGYERG